MLIVLRISNVVITESCRREKTIWLMTTYAILLKSQNEKIIAFFSARKKNTSRTNVSSVIRYIVKWQNNHVTWSAKSAEIDRWIADKRSVICNFRAEQNDVIRCNYRQSPFLLAFTLLVFMRRHYIALTTCRLSILYFIFISNFLWYRAIQSLSL